MGARCGDIFSKVDSTYDALLLTWLRRKNERKIMSYLFDGRFEWKINAKINGQRIMTCVWFRHRLDIYKYVEQLNMY